MKLLVTGGCGFIGSAVVRQAVSRGISVVNVDALTYAANLENVASVCASPLYNFEKVDIRDRNALDGVFSTYSPDAVMHLAAESHVDRSIDGPNEFVSTNVLGTLTLLEAARSYWIHRDRFRSFRFHHVSTDEVFGSLPEDPNVKFSEITPYDPRSPYSASKAASDHLVRAWHHTYGLPIILTNCSNNYGPYHLPEKLIPLTIINAYLGRAIPVYGDGLNVRDWLYVDDHARALLSVIEHGLVGESYNIGGDSEASNIEIVEIICQILDARCPKHSGSRVGLIEFVTDRPGHDRRYAIDARKIQKDLKWFPSVKLRHGLELTVDWYLQNEHWWRPLMDRDSIGERLGTAL